MLNQDEMPNFFQVLERSIVNFSHSQLIGRVILSLHEKLKFQD